jgi:fumarate reductase flavoprotein subunit
VAEQTLLQASGVPRSRVLIVGAGIAGLVAAIRAAECGARAIVLEKLDDRFWVDPLSYHSHTLLPDEPESGCWPGFIYGGGNETLHSGGTLHPITASVDEFLRESWGLGNAGLYKSLKAVSPEVFGALKRWGVDLGLKATIAPDGKRWRGRHLCWNLLKAALDLGVEVRFGTKVVDLLADATGQRVAGVRALGPSGIRSMHANGIVLATGGFEGSEAMKLQYWEPRPQMAQIPVSGSPTNTGDGLLLAQQVGARLQGLSGAHVRTPDAVVYAHGPSRGLGGLYQRGIYVNQDGCRFVDENVSSDILANTIVHQPGFKVFLLWDHRLHEEYRELIYRYTQETLGEAVAPVTSEEFIRRADSLPELASLLSIHPASLETTLAAFNAAVNSDGSTPGIPFGKRANAVRLEVAPFYAHPVTCAVNHGLGGVVTNGCTEVLSTEERVIPGLFACGSTAWLHYGRAYEQNGELRYMSSYPLAAGLTSSACGGHIAGELAAGGVARGCAGG